MDTRIINLILIGFVSLLGFLGILAFMVFQYGSPELMEMYFELLTGLGSGFGGGAIASIIIGRIYINTDWSRPSDMNDKNTNN